MRLLISEEVVTSVRTTLVSTGSRSTMPHMDLDRTLSMSSLLMRGHTEGKLFPWRCTTSLLRRSTGSTLARTAEASFTVTLPELRLPRQRQRLSLRHLRALPRQQRRPQAPRRRVQLHPLLLHPLQPLWHLDMGSAEVRIVLIDSL